MSPPRFDDRDRTCVLDLTAPRAAVAAAIALFARATAYLPRTPRLGEAHGYRVFWLSDGALRWRDVVADGRCHVVVGRHPSAHVRLAGDPTVALRHLVLRAVQEGEGAVELRVLDLGAPTPLLIDASEEHAPSTAVSGPLVGRLGAHAICALPYDGCRETAGGGGPGALDGPEDAESSDAAEAVGSYVPSLVRVRRSRGDECGTSVRTLTASTHIECLGGLEAAPWVELRLVGRLGKVRVSLSREQLEGMVLVGRYDRCIAGSRGVFSARVSRVHVGLIRSGAAVEVLDVGSTNGMRCGGRRVQRVLVEQGAVVEVGGEGERVEIRVRG